MFAKAVAERIVCAVRLSEDCAAEPELRAAHGAELAAMLRAHAPTLLYEDGMTALPVDYRHCREDGCAAGGEEGAVSRSDGGRPVVAFTHVIDCRAAAAADTEAAGTDCSGPRARHVYLQYWFYYPGSATGEGSTPAEGADPDGPAGSSDTPPTTQMTGSRYRCGSAPAAAPPAPARTTATTTTVSPILGPAGRLGAGDRDGLCLRRKPRRAGGSRRSVPRTTKDHRLRLVPIESLAGRDRPTFAVIAAVAEARLRSTPSTAGPTEPCLEQVCE